MGEMLHEQLFTFNKALNNPVCRFTVHGALQSKANTRKLVFNRRTRRPMFIKSERARDFASSAVQQIPILSPLVSGDVAVVIHVYYPTRRNDLDVSLILDLMQGRIYENDRCVKEQHLYHHLDRDNPRVEVVVAVT